MATKNLYSTLHWRASRRAAIERDEGRCTVSRLLGGACSRRGTPHVHHVIPVSDGGDEYALENLATVCPSHHPAWESLRRSLVRARDPEPRVTRCTHRHQSAEARTICERRLARQNGRTVAA